MRKGKYDPNNLLCNAKDFKCSKSLQGVDDCKMFHHLVVYAIAGCEDDSEFEHNETRVDSLLKVDSNPTRANGIARPIVT